MRAGWASKVEQTETELETMYGRTDIDAGNRSVG